MAKPKITDTSKRTKLEELIEGTPLTREQYKHITVDVLHEWLKRNHKEDKETWLSLLENEQEIISLFPKKKKTVPVLDEDGKPVMRETKTRKKKDKDGNIIPATIVANAAVGPVILTLLPPKRAATNPAIIAVKSPVSGVAPDAMASAIERGRAIIATIIPAITSDR